MTWECPNHFEICSFLNLISQHTPAQLNYCICGIYCFMGGSHPSSLCYVSYIWSDCCSALLGYCWILMYRYLVHYPMCIYPIEKNVRCGNKEYCTLLDISYYFCNLYIYILGLFCWLMYYWVHAATHWFFSGVVAHCISF